MSGVRWLLPVLLRALPRGAGAAAPPEFAARPTLGHMAVWVADLDGTARALEGLFGWRRHPTNFFVPATSESFGGMTLAFVDANGMWLELVQPTSLGPGMALLEEKGAGSLVELDFSVPDFDASVARLRGMGINPVGMNGKPMTTDTLSIEWVTGNGERVTGEERLAYLPEHASCGTAIELFWEYPSGVVLYRDRTWSAEQRTPPASPAFDHVVVLARDVDKTSAAYGDTLGLRRAPSTESLPRAWLPGGSQHRWFAGNDRGAWIEVVSPPDGTAGRTLLEEYGDGALMEIAVRVTDLDAFCTRVAEAGTVVTDWNDMPLTAGCPHTAPSDDRYCYLPRASTGGMRIRVFQPAESAHSVFARRNQLRT